MSKVCGWVCVGVWFRHKHIKMSLHNLWLRRLLSSSHFRDPLPTPADMLNIEWGQNFCLEPLLSLSTSNTSMPAQALPSSHCCAHVHACRRARMSACCDPAASPRSLTLHCLIDWCSNATPSEAAEVWIAYKSCSFFPITFLSSDLHYVITSWTVIFKSPHSESFNPGTRTDRQFISSLLYLAGSTTLPPHYFIWPCSVSHFVSAELRKGATELSVAINCATYL